MKNFKKILASVGMLGVAVPTALSVVACKEDPAPPTEGETEVVEKVHLNGSVSSLVHGLDDKLYAIIADESYANFGLWRIDLKTNETSKLGDVDDYVGFLIQGSDGNLYGVNETSDRAKVVKFDLSIKEWVDLGVINNEHVSNLIQGSDGNLYVSTYDYVTGGQDSSIWEVNLKSSTVTKKCSISDDENKNERIGNLIQTSNGNLYAILSTGAIWEVKLGEKWSKEEIYSAPEDHISGTRTIKISDDKFVILYDFGDESKSDLVFSFDLKSKTAKTLYQSELDDIIGLLFKIDNKLYALAISLDDDEEFINFKIYQYDLGSEKLVSQKEIEIGDKNDNKAGISMNFGINDKLYFGNGSGRIYEISF